MKNTRRICSTIVLVIALSVCIAAAASAPAETGLIGSETVVCSAGGYAVTRGALDALYEAYYGGGPYDEQTEYDLRYELAQMLLDDLVESVMIERLGLSEVSSLDRERIEAQASVEYEETLAAFAQTYQNQGHDAEEARSLAVAYMASIEMSYDDYVAKRTADVTGERLREYALTGASVPQEELYDLFLSLAEDDRALYETFPEEFEYCSLYGISYLYVPEGYRRVQQITFAFDDDELARYDTLLGAAADAAAWDALYARVEGLAEIALREFAAGASFETLISRYGDDLPGSGSDGFLISAGSTYWDEAFVKAALSLETPGDICGPVRCADGVHIALYVGEEEPGPVDFACVSDFVADAARYLMEDEMYASALDGWAAECGATIHIDALG